MRVCIGHPGYISEMVRLIPAQAVLRDGTALYEPIVPFFKTAEGCIFRKRYLRSRILFTERRNFMKKQLLTGVLAGLMMLSCAGCGASNAAGSASAASTSAAASGTGAAGRDTLHVAIMTDPEGLDPQKTSATSTYFVTMNVYEPLVMMDENCSEVLNPIQNPEFKIHDPESPFVL